MAKDILVSVVLPVRNVAPKVAAFAEKLSAVLSANYKDYEIIVVDDASKDGTPAAIEAVQKTTRNIQLYALSRRSGISIATVAGLDNAIGDYVITMDIERDPVEKIPEMVEMAVNGTDIVYGVNENRAKPSSFYDRAALTYYLLFSLLTDLDIPRQASSFRLMSRAVVNYITGLNDRHRLLSVLPAISGYRFAVIRYTGEQVKHELTLGFLAKCGEAMGVLFACSVKPLRFATYAALLAGGLNLLYAVYVVIVALIKPDVAEGWVSLSLQSSCMFFLLSLVLTIVSEYLYGIMERTQNHPLYHIAKESSSTVFRRKEDLNVVEKV